MNKKKILAFVTFLIFIAFIASALSINVIDDRKNLDGKKYEIHLKSGHVLLSEGISTELRAKANAAIADRMHVLIQFKQIPDREQKKELEQIGVKLLAYIPDNAWYASIPRGKIDNIAGVSFVRSMGVISPDYKLSPKLKNGDIGDWAIEKSGNAILIVEFNEDVSLEYAEKDIRSKGLVIYNKIETLNALTISVPRNSIIGLANDEMIQWVDEIPPSPIPMLDQSRGNIGADVVQTSPYNLTGEGVSVLVYDGEEVYNHTDFLNRLFIGEDNQIGINDIDKHATRVAGIIAGNGTMNYSLRGVATKANIVSYNYSGINYNVSGNIEEEYNESINDANHSVDLASNSWGETGSFVCNCSRLGSYTVNAELFDNIVRGSLGKLIPIVFSAGNERLCDGCSGYNTTSSPSTAKNVIAVGATNSNDDSVWYESSWGPSDDTRLKPDVVAPGCQNNNQTLGINTTSFEYVYPNYYPSYSPGPFGCGTSFAAPHVSGTLALMIQQYRTSYNIQTPWPSTLKALLIHSATDLNNTGPDYITGYGKINATKAVDLIIEKSLIEGSITNQNETDEYKIFVPNQEDELKLTLVWDDPAAQPFADKELVNDLDLVVIAPNGSRYYPWILNPGNPSQPATTGVDHVNNVEQVLVKNPIPGIWTVSINGSIAVGDYQNYSLVGPFTFKVRNLQIIFSNESQRIFGFSIINNRNENVTSINWSLDTGEIQDSSDYLSNLSPGKSIFVYFHYNYTDGDIYSINATATSGNLSDSETMTISVGDIIAYDMKLLDSSSRERIFGFKILNNMNSSKAVNWTLNTGQGAISANSLTYLNSSKTVFVYVAYNYTAPGTFTVNATGMNGSISDSTRNIVIDV